MRRHCFMILVLIFFIVGCEEDLVIDTSKDTYYDDIADI